MRFEFGKYPYPHPYPHNFSRKSEPNHGQASTPDGQAATYLHTEFQSLRHTKDGAGNLAIADGGKKQRAGF